MKFGLILVLCVVGCSSSIPDSEHTEAAKQSLRKDVKECKGKGDTKNCCPAPIPPTCQSGSLLDVNIGCTIQCYGTYYPPYSTSGNGGVCGGGLVEGPGDGSTACFCLPDGTGAPNSGCPSDGAIHYYINGTWQ